MSNEGSDGDPDGPNHAESDAGLSDRESSDRGQDVVSHAGSNDEERPDSDDDDGADGANESDGGQDVVSHAGSNDEDGPLMAMMMVPMVPMKVSLVSIKHQMKLHLTQSLPWLTAF